LGRRLSRGTQKKAPAACLVLRRESATDPEVFSPQLKAEPCPEGGNIPLGLERRGEYSAASQKIKRSRTQGSTSKPIRAAQLDGTNKEEKDTRIPRGFASENVNTGKRRDRLRDVRQKKKTHMSRKEGGRNIMQNDSLWARSMSGIKERRGLDRDDKPGT